jgi:hypothetical protein
MDEWMDGPMEKWLNKQVYTEHPYKASNKGEPFYTNYLSTITEKPESKPS